MRLYWKALAKQKGPFLCPFLSIERKSSDNPNFSTGLLLPEKQGEVVLEGQVGNTRAGHLVKIANTRNNRLSG